MPVVRRHLGKYLLMMAAILYSIAAIAAYLQCGDVDAPELLSSCAQSIALETSVPGGEDNKELAFGDPFGSLEARESRAMLLRSQASPHLSTNQTVFFGPRVTFLRC